jgi:hypothetical protein
VLRLEEVSFDVRMPGERSETRVRPGSDIEWSSTRSLRWTDEYVSVDEERPRRIRRAFECLATRERKREEGASRFGALTDADEGASALEGKAVLFDWDSELEDYRVTAEPFEYIDRDLLDALSIETGSACVLPGRPVDAEDSWTVGPEVLQQLVRPGGRVPFDALGASVFDELLTENDVATLDGAPRVILVEIEPGELGELAHLRIEGRLEGRTEPHESDLATFLGYGVPGTTLRSTSLAFELDGEVVWDVSARHLSRLELTARAEIVVESVHRRPDADWEYCTSETWRGELALQATVEP